MRKKIQVKHTHRYTKSENVLFNGYANCHDYANHLDIEYCEIDGTRVAMFLYDDYMIIERFGEVHSQLHLYRNKTTKNPLKSVYGIFEIDIITYEYKKENNYIMVEYDIENGSLEKDGYKIEIDFKEEAHEYN